MKTPLFILVSVILSSCASNESPRNERKSPSSQTSSTSTIDWDALRKKSTSSTSLIDWDAANKKTTSSASTIDWDAVNNGSSTRKPTQSRRTSGVEYTADGRIILPSARTASITHSKQPPRASVENEESVWDTISETVGEVYDSTAEAMSSAYDSSVEYYNENSETINKVVVAGAVVATGVIASQYIGDSDDTSSSYNDDDDDCMKRSCTAKEEEIHRSAFQKISEEMKGYTKSAQKAICLNKSKLHKLVNLAGVTTYTLASGAMGIADDFGVIESLADVDTSLDYLESTHELAEAGLCG